MRYTTVKTALRLLIQLATILGAFLCCAQIVHAQNQIGVSTTTVSFSAQAIGGSSPPVTVTVTNLDTVAHTLSVVLHPVVLCFPAQPGCPPPGYYTDFSLSTDCAQAPLAPGASCTVAVAFLPTAAGTRVSSILVYVPGLGSNFARDISLLGTGIFAAIPTVHWSVLVLLTIFIALLAYVRPNHAFNRTAIGGAARRPGSRLTWFR